jgi:DNA-binding CsgD family transcriptional regulator
MDDQQARALVDFLEAAYCLETNDQAWLQAVTNAAAGVSRCPFVGAHSLTYDASDLAAFRATTMHVDGPSETPAILQEALGQFTPHFVARTYRSGTLFAPSGRTVSAPEMDGMFAKMAAMGVADLVAINGFDPTGMGVCLQLWVPHLVDFERTECALFRRVAHHLSAAHRVRRRLRSSGASADTADGAEAVLDRHGRVVHASGPAKNKTAQMDLVETSKARDATLSRRGDRAHALGRWRPLTDARWTLVDSFERDGARYIVARENQAEVQGLLALSDRERQVVAYVALGQSTKETAYALGISDTTVRVHLKHAATKLGVRTRAELLRHRQVKALCPHT